jgi:SAM-dependent methyltransferase
MDDSRMREVMFRYVESDGGRAYLESHFSRFRETLRLIPVDRPRTVLDLGTFLPFAALLRDATPHQYLWHGHWKGEAQKTITAQGESFQLNNVDLEKDPFPFPDASFDLILCGEVIEHLGLDPFCMMSEINRVLKPGGQLLLSTPNITATRNFWKMLFGYAPYLYASFTLNRDRHNREYTPAEIQVLFTESGFALDEFFTRDVYFLPIPPFSRSGIAKLILTLFFRVVDASRWRGDTIFALGHKTGPLVHRYPLQFYDIPPESSPSAALC